MNLLTSRIAAAGILRLALRWPALTLILVLSVVATRIIAGRRHRRNGIARVVRAPGGAGSASTLERPPY